MSERVAQSQEVDDPFAPGSKVDHFQVVRRLGRGGMGEVYLARDTTLGRRVALKVIHPARLGAQAATDRFLREARTTASFSHPNIVAIHFAGSHGGRPYVALEYLEGETLRQRMRVDRPGTKEALRWGLAIADALTEAHRHRILHRDLKPENVMLCRDGRLRVVDFGLAKLVESPDEPPDQAEVEAITAERETLSTLGKQVRGTPEYMAPEQWRDGPVTEAADVWALGVMLYEMFCGHRPYPGASFFGLALKAAGPGPVPPLPVPEGDSLAPSAAELVHRCLEKDPGKRPTAARVAQRLRELVAGRAEPLSPDQESPFRGLRPFTERQASLFFGRELEVSAFVEQLREEPVLPVVGPSGAGKSSFVRAGVIPRLQEHGSWTVLRLRPGERPFYALALQLVAAESPSRQTVSAETPLSLVLPTESGGRPSRMRSREQLLEDRLLSAPHLLSLTLERIAVSRGTRVLLFVDQLEELFTLVTDEQVRSRFLDALCSAADDPENPMRVVFTLREDFLGRLAGGRWVRETLRRLVLLGPPDADGLERILAEPARAVGYGYDDEGLVPEMVEAAGAEVASLPLLQFAAQMLWDRRDRQTRQLTRAAYEKMGGVEGALAAHAEGVLAGLPPAAQGTMRELFLRLVTAERTRRVLPRGRLLEGLGPDAEELLGRLTDSRLIVVRRALSGGEEEPTFELVHESLIHHWGRLSRWIERGRDDLAFLGEVEQAATLWDRRGRRDDDLWQGDALREALAALSRCGAPVPGLVQRFLEHGRRRHRRAVRRRQVALALVVALALAVALVFAYQKREADRQRDQTRQRWAEAQREGARAALGQDGVLEARSRLRGSLEAQDSPVARALWLRLERDPRVWSRRLGGSVYGVAFSPDGKQVAAACQDGTVHLLDAATAGEEILRGYRDQVLAVTFDAEGRLAAGTWSGQVSVRGARGGSPRLVGEGRAAALSLAFGTGGRFLASAVQGGNARIWDTRGARPVEELPGTSGTLAVAYGPDGRWLALGGLGGLQLISRQRGRPERVRLQQGQVSLGQVAFSPDGRWLASAGTKSVVAIWDLRRRAVARELRGARGAILGLAYSPDGKHVAGGEKGGSVYIWDATSGELVRRLAGGGAVHGIAYSPDGLHLAVGRQDGVLVVYSVAIEPLRRTEQGSGGRVFGASFSPDGQILAGAGEDGAIRLWDVTSGVELRRLTGHTDQVRRAAFSPDGVYLASIGYDRSLRLWHRKRGYTTRTLGGHWGRIFDLAYSPDGRALATAGNDTAVRLWDARSGVQRALLTGHRDAVVGVSFSADGGLLASGSQDGTIRLWRADTGAAVGAPLVHEAPVTGVAFAPVGTDLATGDAKGKLLLWNLETRQPRTLWDAGGRGYSLAFHPSGRVVGVPLADGTAALVSREGGLLRLLRGHRAEVNTLRFSPDGNLVATASDDGTIRLWRVTDGVPLWRAPALLSSPARLFTHLGCVELEGGKVRSPRPGLEQTVAASLTAEEASDGGLCLLTRDERLERWSGRGGAPRRVLSVAVPGADGVVAFPGGCVVLSRGKARIYRGARLQRELAASAAAWDGESLLLASGGTVRRLGPAGREKARVAVGDGVTALARVGRTLILGFRDGTIETASLAGGADSRRLDGPPSAVTRLAVGPRGTVVAGFESGQVGLWSLRSGEHLLGVRLHGPVAHLQRAGARVHAATDLGDRLSLDLHVFDLAYCDLLREVWRRAPTVWEDGLPVVRPPPAGHRCRR